jgi:hypothetical protein
MLLAAKRDDRTVREGDRLGKTVHLPFQPIHVAREESAGLFDAHMIGHRQYRDALGVADLQGETSGAPGTA